MADKIQITNVSVSISIPVVSKQITEVLDMPHNLGLLDLMEAYEQRANEETDAEAKAGYNRVSTACRTAINCKARLSSSEYVISKINDSILLELIFPDYNSLANFVSIVKVAP